MNLKVLAMAIAYSSSCGALAPDTQIKVDSAVEALSPNARVRLGAMTHRGTLFRSESDLGNYGASSRRHRVHENHEKQCQVLRTKVENTTK
jgi:formamidopyrimidine-DNA glycosylase